MPRVGQNRICAPYMTLYLVISLPKIPYIHRIYIPYIWSWPTLEMPDGKTSHYGRLCGKVKSVCNKGGEQGCA